MIIPVTLAGHTGGWTFRNARLFDRWMAAPGGRGEGRTCLIRTTGPHGQKLIDEHLFWNERLACLRDGRRRLVRLDDLGACPSVERELACRLGDAVPAPRADATSVLAELCSSQTVVVHACIRDDAGRTHWNDVVRVVEELGKRAGAALRAVATDVPRYRASGGTDIDFTVGWPIERVLDYAGLGRQSLWQAYVHARIAWDAGGNLDRALEWAAAPPTGRTGDDEGLESWLQRVALATFHVMSRQDKEHAMQAIDRRDAETEPDAPAGDGAYWRPPGCAALRPTPWFARALLGHKPRSPYTDALRAATNCLPLAAEILQRCIDGEAAVRGAARRRGLPKPGAAQDFAYRNHSRFVAGDSQSHFYPSAHPAPPTSEEDVWTFAPFGEVIGVAGLSGAAREAADRLRELRNAVAHGHYVCWRHVEQVLDIGSGSLIGKHCR